MLENTFERAGTCPFCTKKIELATNISGGREPEAGDLSMCIECGEFSIFDPALAAGLRKPNALEYEKIVNTPDARRAREAWVAVKQRREEAKPEKKQEKTVGIIDLAFERLVKTLYTRGAMAELIEEEPRFREELRRIFFAGSMVTLKMLGEAHEDDSTDTIIFGSLFNDLVTETHKFTAEIQQKRNGKRRDGAT